MDGVKWNFLKNMGWNLGILEEEVNEGVKKEDPNDVNEDVDKTNKCTF